MFPYVPILSLVFGNPTDSKPAILNYENPPTGLDRSRATAVEVDPELKVWSGWIVMDSDGYWWIWYM